MMAVMMVLRASVARSANSERKLCTGRPSSVRLVLALRLAAVETDALATNARKFSEGGLASHFDVSACQSRRLSLDDQPLIVRRPEICRFVHLTSDGYTSGPVH